MHQNTKQREMKEDKGKARKKRFVSHELISFMLAFIVFLVVYLIFPETVEHDAKMVTAIVGFGIVLWALEPVPIGLTALIIMLLLLLFNVADLNVIFSGFASPAVYLVVGGMMLAKAVNETNWSERITYWMIKKWGNTAKGLLGSLMLIMQFQAFFIPATAVRTTLMLPITNIVLKTIKAKPGSNLEKMILLGVAYAGNISGTAILTAAVGNILTVELINRYLNIHINYFEWFFYTFPIWLLLIPTIWIILLRLYPLPEEEKEFTTIQKEMEEKLIQLGPIKSKDWRCLFILLIIVGLWMTEPLHQLHPSIPALIGVIFMTLPEVGITRWDKVVQINYDTILILGVTLSMGYVFVDSGAAHLLGDLLSVQWISTIMEIEILAILFIVLFTQLFHKLISNVSTAVVTLIPIIMSMAESANVEPFSFVFLAGVTCLFGYMFVVETMPNLIIHSTGRIAQRDFMLPGIIVTLITTFITVITAFFWWNIIGLL